MVYSARGTASASGLVPYQERERERGRRGERAGIWTWPLALALPRVLFPVFRVLEEYLEGGVRAHSQRVARSELH